jgi:hypothetical protein
MNRADFKPMHVTVAEAVPGDVGFVWWIDDWFIARIIEDGDKTFAVLLRSDGSEWLDTAIESVASMPWYEVSHPTYELNGDPLAVTSTLTYRDGAGSWTLSWQMPLDQCGTISRSVYDLASTMLKTEKAASDA